jgi:hypothetical protein
MGKTQHHQQLIRKKWLKNLKLSPRRLQSQSVRKLPALPTEKSVRKTQSVF